MLEHGIKPGLSASVSQQTMARSEDVAREGFELGTLLSTGTLAAMVAESSIQLIDPHLPPEYFSVGKRFEVDHEAPVLGGGTITLQIKVTEVENNWIRFAFEGHDEKGRFCTGVHERILIQRNKLFDIAYERAQE